MRRSFGKISLRSDPISPKSFPFVSGSAAVFFAICLHYGILVQELHPNVEGKSR